MGCISGDVVFGYYNSPEFDRQLKEFEEDREKEWTKKIIYG